MSKQLGKLTRLDLREYWGEEAKELTPWLAQPDNLDLLEETINIDLELVATESSVGPFRADILAREAGTDDKVIIENQLERTNHDHLGKLITYASGHNAKAVVWVAREITEEHRRALEWLNNVTGESVGFFGLEIELWRIGDSAPAPKFNLVCQPNEWLKGISGGSVEPTETKLTQLEFWKAFIEYARGTGTLLSLRKPRHQQWYTLAVGRAGFHISLTIHSGLDRVGCELYINHEQSKVAFAELLEQRAEIDSEVRAKLDWQELPHRHACRIAQFHPLNLDSRDEWAEAFQWLLERAEAFHKVFSPRVRALNLSLASGGELVT